MPKINPAQPRYGVAKRDPRTGMVAPQQGEFKRGLRSGLGQVSAIASGVESAGRAYAGDQEGADIAAHEAERQLQEASQFGPSVKTVQEVHDIDSFTDWAAGAIGQQLPIMGTMLAGSPAALGVRGAVRGALPKAQLPGTGATALTGMVGSASAVETGSIFPEIQLDPVARETLTPRERVATAVGGGVAAGSLEALPFVGIAKRFGLGKSAKRLVEKNLAKEVAKGAGFQAGAEAGTEAAQTVIERAAVKFANENKEILGEEGWNEIINAAATGALLGGGLGGVGGVSRYFSDTTAKGVDAIGERIKDIQASDELAGLKEKVNISKLRERFKDRPGIAKELDDIMAQDLEDPTARDESIKFSQALTEIAVTEDVLEDRGYLSQQPEQMNDILTLSEYARDPELIDTDVLEELDKRYGSTQGNIFDILDDIRDRISPETQEQAEAAVTGFEAEETGQTVGKELEADYEVAPTYITDTDYRTEVETAKEKAKARGGKPVSTFEVADALTDEQAKTQISKLVSEETGITGFGEEDTVTSGGFVYTKVPLSEMVVEAVKTGQTRSLRMRDKTGALITAKPTLISEGGKFTADQVIGGAARKVLKSRSDKQLWEAIKPAKNAAYSAKAVQTLKQQAVTDPKQFLSNFYAIKKQKMVADTAPLVPASADDTTISLSELDVKPTTDPKVRKGIVRSIPAGGLKGPRAQAEAPLIQVARDKEGRVKRKEQQKDISVNFPSMVGRALTQLSRAERSLGQPSVRNITRAFREGMTSLMADHGLLIKNLSKLPDSTVVFFYGSGKKVTLGQVRNQIKKEIAQRAAKPDFRSGVEATDREINQDIEDAVNELFEENKGRVEDKLSLRDIDREDVAELIEALTLYGYGRESKFVAKPTHRTEAAQAARAKRELELSIQSAARKKKLKVKKSKAVSGKAQAQPNLQKFVAAARAGNVQLKQVHPDVITSLDDIMIRFDLPKARLQTLEDSARTIIMSGRIDALNLNQAGKISFNNQLNGFATMDGQIFVNPNLSREAQLEVLAHEAGHLIFSKYLSGNKSAEWRASLKRQFEAWREEMTGGTYADVLNSKATLNLAIETLSNSLNNSTGQLNPKLKDLTQGELQYILDFEEWFADNTARYVADPTLVPKNAIQRMFKNIAKALLDLFKNFRGEPDVVVEHFLRSVESRVSATIQAQVQQNMIQKAASFLRGIKMSGQTRKLLEEGEGIGAYIASRDLHDLEGRAAIARWIEVALTQEERRALTDAFSQPHARKKIEELTGSIVSAPLQSLAVGVQLWNAGLLSVGPKTQTLLQKFVKWIQEFLGIPTKEQKSEAIMEAIMKSRISTQIEQRSFQLTEIYRDDLLARTANVVNDQGSRIFQFLEAYTYTADSRMQRLPALQAIAQKFHARVGMEGVTGPSYFEARATNVGKFTDRVERILEGLDDAAKLRILNDAQQEYTGTGLSQKEKVASGALRKLLEDMYKYAEDNGVSTMIKGKDAAGNVQAHQTRIKHRKKYFPVVYDMQYMQDNRDRFIKMLSQDKYKRFFKEDGTGPEGIYQHLVENMGYGDTDVSKLSERAFFTPAMSAVNQRTLDWIDPKDREPFLNKSLEYTMVQYIDSLVKRAEYTKRFDTDGRTLETLMDNARASGATDKEMKTAEHFVQAALGNLGRETNVKLHGLFHATPAPGQVINPTLQKAMSSVIVFRNLAILGLSAFTSLADVVGISVRSGRMIPFEAYKQGLQEIQNGIKNLGKKDGELARSTMSELARGLGVIDTHMTNEALEYQYGGTYMSSRLKGINESFFKAIGLTQLTKLTRVMALASAKNFIETHNKMDTEQSQRFMEELGIKQGDVKFDSKGKLIVLTRAGRETLEGEANSGDEEAAAALAKDDRVRNGLFRWVDGAILRPNAAQRPIWASDPHYMLFFHLKSFMYSFHDRILRRVWTEAAKHGNYMPFMAVMIYIPAMIAIDAARDWLKYGFNGSPRKANWGYGDYVENAANRAGLYGVGATLVTDAMSDRQFGGVGYESSLGAAQYVIDTTAGVITGDQRKIEKALPAASIWRGWTQ